MTQFSQAYNVVDAPPTNFDGFLSRDTCVASTQLNRPIWNKMCVSPLDYADSQAVFLSRTNSVPTGKQGARYSTI
jgi:hypothetical protein